MDFHCFEKNRLILRLAGKGSRSVEIGKRDGEPVSSPVNYCFSRLDTACWVNLKKSSFLPSKRNPESKMRNE